MSSFMSLAMLGMLATIVSAQEPSTTGFIGIDCGLDGAANYTDKDDGLVYSSDENYISTGVNMKVSQDINLTSKKAYCATIRSFPEGIRNCYTLGPVKSGSKYRVNAQFLYGNYDGLDREPTFDVYLGVNFWMTVGKDFPSLSEIITIAYSDNIQVCLINIGRGTPFISELDLRPIPFSMYDMVNDSSSSVVFHYERTNYGAEGQIRYPEDIYDRIWNGYYDHGRYAIEKNISTTRSVNLLDGDNFTVPQAVLRTAVEAKALTDSLDISAFGLPSEAFFIYMYFAELRELQSNETREFSIYAGDELVFGPFKPRYLQQDVYRTSPPKRQELTYYIRATEKSTLPPLINAKELLSHIQMPLLPTVARDAKAMLDLKKQFNVRKNWQGDPCVPRNFVWKGVTCAYDDSNYSIVTSLDLSQSLLRGKIPLSISRLINLTSLDLSYNFFTGEIPHYLGEMPALKFLNLEGNYLNGTVPTTICGRLKNGSLVLMMNGNPCLCSTKKRSIIILVSVAASVATLLLIAAIITVYAVNRTKTLKHKSGGEVEGKNVKQHYECRILSEADIKNITKNFKHPIGRGSCGMVYRGNLDDGTLVAVKVLFKTVHQERQFKAEADLQTRIHHKHLVSLLGYSVKNLALVYEFASLGSLTNHLSGDSPHRNVLNWVDRLQIAQKVANVLDYLHNGCEPPVLHGDLRISDILLTTNFEVKLADIARSESLFLEENTYMSTSISSIDRYLNPEYQQKQQHSTKSGIFSFGVVLLEIVTGKALSTDINNDAHSTKEVLKITEREDIAEIADPRMLGGNDSSSLRRVIDIALLCTSPNLTQRPSIREVASHLKKCLQAELSSNFSIDNRSDVISPSHEHVEENSNTSSV